MDHARCNVIYVDARARDARLVRKEDSTPASTVATSSSSSSYFDVGESGEVLTNVQIILSTFNQGQFLLSNNRVVCLHRFHRITLQPKTRIARIKQSNAEY